MAASYPGAVKTFSAVVNGVTKLVAALFNSPYDEITAIETELGTDVAGSLTDLKTRLAVSLNNDGTFKPKFIRVVTYTGDGNDDRTVAHGLDATPTFVMIFAASNPASGNCVWGGTGFTAGHSHYIAGPGDSTTAIKSVDATNVTLGTSALCNENGTSYLMLAVTGQ